MRASAPKAARPPVTSSSSSNSSSRATPCPAPRTPWRRSGTRRVQQERRQERRQRGSRTQGTEQHGATIIQSTWIGAAAAQLRMCLLGAPWKRRWGLRLPQHRATSAQSKIPRRPPWTLASSLRSPRRRRWRSRQHPRAARSTDWHAQRQQAARQRLATVATQSPTAPVWPRLQVNSSASCRAHRLPLVPSSTPSSSRRLRTGHRTRQQAAGGRTVTQAWRRSSQHRTHV